MAVALSIEAMERKMEKNTAKSPSPERVRRSSLNYNKYAED
jgi:hypothetical protein